MKNYIGISKDHSVSMRTIAKAAARDYNSQIESIQLNSVKFDQDTIVNVVKNGVGRSGLVVREIVNSNVHTLKPIPEWMYVVDGGSTPLFDSVGELIEIMQSVPDANDPMVSFLVVVITDGVENSSKKWRYTLAAKIKELQATDRWTFVFRVPRGNARSLAAMGIHEGNILEWDQTDRGVAVSTAATNQGYADFYAARATGKTSTKQFYSDLKDVSVAEVKAACVDISSNVMLWPISASEDGSEIRPFVENRLGKNMLKGAAFYQLMKTEKQVQDYKVICIRDKSSGSVYSGPGARQMLGLPTSGTVKLCPGDHGNFEIFIQSTSVNRKLVGGTTLLYWAGVGQPYVSGQSVPDHQNFAPIPASAIASATPVSSAYPPDLTVITVGAAKYVPVPRASLDAQAGRIQLVRKKDGVFVMSVDTMLEALSAINKAKSGKKATLIIKS